MTIRRTRSAEQRAIIDKLFRLRQKVYQERSHRVEFVCLALKHGLASEVIHYELWDEGWEGLGERVWDACFEMGDSELALQTWWSAPAAKTSSTPCATTARPPEPSSAG